jgi:TetR/AcrR family transcriptional repressor of nem operon
MPATKGEQTRERIVAAAAPLFNRRGYAASSISELMAATGLEKGGIYRHFESKDELALAAFDHTLSTQSERIRRLVEAERGAINRLTALARGIAGAFDRSAVPGGCPLLNTAIESDDGEGAVHVELRKRTRAGMRRLIDSAQRIIAAGIETGEISASVDARAEAESFVAGIEGALMLAKLFDEPRYVRHAVDRVAVNLKRLAPSRR